MPLLVKYSRFVAIIDPLSNYTKLRLETWSMHSILSCITLTPRQNSHLARRRLLARQGNCYQSSSP
jgi:hypothetical protein